VTSPLIPFSPFYLFQNPAPRQQQRNMSQLPNLIRLVDYMVVTSLVQLLADFTEGVQHMLESRALFTVHVHFADNEDGFEFSPKAEELQVNIQSRPGLNFSLPNALFPGAAETYTFSLHSISHLPSQLLTCTFDTIQHLQINKQDAVDEELCAATAELIKLSPRVLHSHSFRELFEFEGKKPVGPDMNSVIMTFKRLSFALARCDALIEASFSEAGKQAK
jgi:hypothetical protein